MKKAISIIMVILLLANFTLVPVKADIKGMDVATEADSEDNRYVFDGYLLKQVKDNGKVLVENDYDSNGMRVAKRGAEECQFTYDENKNLVKEERNGKVITYFYEKDEEYEYWHIMGFSYEGKNYYYTRDDLSRIAGIKNESGELVARYEYGAGNNRVEKVMKKQDEEWISTEDLEFVGNVNRIRDISEYYDLECELYYQYNGVFVDVVTNDIIWNVNENLEISLFSDSNDLDYELYCWQQSLLNDTKFNERLSSDSSWHVGLSDVAVIARIVYAENTSVTADQNAISWVIRNRAVKKNMSVRDVVLEEGQFSTAAPSELAIAAKNKYELGWESAVYKACLLCWTLDKDDWDSLNSIPYGMGEQQCFRSIRNNYSNFSGANPMHYDKDTYHTAAYHAYIAGYGEVNSYSTLCSIKNNYLNQNIYFSEYNY